MGYIDTYYHKKISCNTCNGILDSICRRMKPFEAKWFSRSVVEIQEHDGHLICERFLRLYACGFFVYESDNREEVKSEAFWKMQFNR